MRTPLFSGMNSLRVSKGILLLAAVIAACLCPTASWAQASVDDNWTAMDGAWSTAADWSAGVPNNTSSTIYNVFIQNGTSTNPTLVNLDISPTVKNLTVGTYDSLMVPSSQTLTITGSSIDNAGTISSGASAGLQLVIAGSNVTLSGGGTLNLSNQASNSISASVAGNTLVNEETIEGSGTIGGGSLILNNSGTINANRSTPLILNVAGTDTNSGALEASGGGTLVINGGIIQNTGSIDSNIMFGNTASPLVVVNGTTINGGSINASTDFHGDFGIIQLNNVTLNGTSVGPVSGTGAATVQFSGTSVVNGGSLGAGVISNGGNLTLNNTSNHADLESGDVTVTGSFTNYGTIIVNTLTIDTSNVTVAAGGEVADSVISAAAAGDTLTNQGLISGMIVVGNIGPAPLSIGDGGLVVVNSGTITKGTLYVQNVTDTNTGTLAVSIIGSGTAVITNTGGIIKEATGAEIEDVTINGGTLMGGGTLNSATLSGVTIKGTGIFVSEGSTINGGNNAATLEVANGSSLTLADGFTSTGKIKLEAGGSATQLLISGNLTLAGTISMSNSANNVIEGASTGTETLTNKGTLEGSGNIGNGFMGLVNTGTILANQSTPLTVDVSSAGFTNTGKLTVNAGDTLNISGPANSFTDSGTVKVSSGGTLAMGMNLNFTQTKGSTTVDGTLSVASLNSINISGGTLYGNNGMLDGNFSLSGTGVVNPGDGSKKIGELTIDGTYTQASKSNLIIDLGGTTADTGYSVLNITDAASLSGKLTVDLVNGFVPAAGDTFTIMDFSSETGTFSTKNLPTLSGGDTWLITYNATDIVLTVEAPAAPASASLSSVNGTPARWTRSTSLIASGAGLAHERSAILTPAETCGGLRIFASFACVSKAFSGVATGVGSTIHSSAGSERASATISTRHNNVAARAGAGASHDTRTPSAASLARRYFCAYLPADLSRSIIGCNGN